MSENAANLETMKSRMPPPLPCLIGLILGLMLGWVWPQPIASYGISLAVGLVIIAIVVWLSVSMALAFRRHGTSPDPASETTAVVESGPFRFSRNPAYLTAALLQVGLGFVFNNLWVVLLTVPAVIVIQKLVVAREEAYLEAKFGDAYRDYKSRVRRWI